MATTVIFSPVAVPAASVFIGHALAHPRCISLLSPLYNDLNLSEFSCSDDEKELVIIVKAAPLRARGSLGTSFHCHDLGSCELDRHTHFRFSGEFPCFLTLEPLRNGPCVPYP